MTATITATATPKATIATATGGNAGIRCATCRKPIRELDPIATTARSLRPAHFGCLPRATQADIEAAISDAPPERRCAYGDDISGQCPYPVYDARVCRGHHRELYGVATSARRARGR